MKINDINVVKRTHLVVLNLQFNWFHFWNISWKQLSIHYNLGVNKLILISRKFCRKIVKKSIVEISENFSHCKNYVKLTSNQRFHFHEIFRNQFICWRKLCLPRLFRSSSNDVFDPLVGEDNSNSLLLLGSKPDSLRRGLLKFSGIVSTEPLDVEFSAVCLHSVEVGVKFEGMNGLKASFSSSELVSLLGTSWNVKRKLFLFWFLNFDERAPQTAVGHRRASAL